MTDERLDEIKTKWNIPVTLPMAVPWGKDDVVWLVGEVTRLRAEAKRADEEATKLANSDLTTTEQILRALRVENDALRAKVRTITENYKPGWVDGLHAVARSAGYDPDKLHHEGVDPPTFIEDVILGLRADLAKAQEKAAIYEKDWREAKAEFGTATSKLREQLRASEESATRGWEVADSFHITVSGLEAEIERLRVARGDYSDPLSKLTPEQRTRVLADEERRAAQSANNPHRGSTFDSWLDEEGIRDEVEAAAKGKT